MAQGQLMVEAILVPVSGL